MRAAQKELDAHLRAAGQSHLLRWTPIENIHLTLRFLGESSATQRGALEHALAQVAASHAPLALELAGLGAFPSFRRPSVLWAGLRGPAQQLAALAALQAPIEQAARAARFAAEERPFSPHLTLARFKREAPAPALAAVGGLLQADAATSLLGTQRAPFPITELLLMQSDLRPAGPLYTPLARFALTGAVPGA